MRMRSTQTRMFERVCNAHGARPLRRNMLMNDLSGRDANVSYVGEMSLIPVFHSTGLTRK